MLYIQNCVVMDRVINLNFATEKFDKDTPDYKFLYLHTCISFVHIHIGLKRDKHS